MWGALEKSEWSDPAEPMEMGQTIDHLSTTIRYGQAQYALS